MSEITYRNSYGVEIKIVGAEDVRVTASDGVKTEADEIAWLIEETWSGYVHYVHRDFRCDKMATEWRKNDFRRSYGAPALQTQALVTKNIEEAMRFPTKDAADLWLAIQPFWMRNGDQYRVREHMWPPESQAADSLSASPIPQVEPGVNAELLEALKQISTCAYVSQDGHWNGHRNPIVIARTAIAKAEAALPAASGWRTIDSAPRDRVTIDLWHGGERYANHLWTGSGWGSVEIRNRRFVTITRPDLRPTHWMPLPDPPALPSPPEVGLG